MKLTQIRIFNSERSSVVLLVVLLVELLHLIDNNCVSAVPVGFSYAKFSGPVSGPEREVFIQDEHGHGQGHVDYIAKPDYQFSYGVEDPKTHVLQNRKESRNGDAVQGEYSVVDPDGTLRVVRYTADKVNGFQAEVITDGKAQAYGHDTGGNHSGNDDEDSHHHQQHNHQQHNHHQAPLPLPVHAPHHQYHEYRPVQYINSPHQQAQVVKHDGYASSEDDEEGEGDEEDDEDSNEDEEEEEDY